METALRAQHPRIKDWLMEHRDEFCGPGRPVWVARENGGIGAVLIARIDRTKDAKCSILFAVKGFSENHLRSGLLGEFERVAGSLGKGTVHLHLYADDETAIGFFRSHGYHVVNPEVYHPTENPGRVRVLMVKRPLLRT